MKVTTSSKSKGDTLSSSEFNNLLKNVDYKTDPDSLAGDIADLDSLDLSTVSIPEVTITKINSDSINTSALSAPALTISGTITGETVTADSITVSNTLSADTVTASTSNITDFTAKNASFTGPVTASKGITANTVTTDTFYTSSITTSDVTVTGTSVFTGSATFKGKTTLPDATISELTSTNVSSSTLTTSTSSITDASVSNTLTVGGTTTLASVNSTKSTVDTASLGSLSVSDTATFNGGVSFNDTANFTSVSASDLTSSNVTVTGTLSLGTLDSNYIDNAYSISTGSLTSTGNIKATGKVTASGAQITSLKATSGYVTDLSAGKLTIESDVTFDSISVTDAYVGNMTTTSGLRVGAKGVKLLYNGIPDVTAGTLYKYNNKLYFGTDSYLTTDDALSGLIWQSVYNATTNTPELPTPATDNAGYFWKVSVSGTQSINDVDTYLGVGYWIISNGSELEVVGTSEDVFNGASSDLDGTSGDVPAPSAGDQDKSLHGDGTWRYPYSAIVQDDTGECIDVSLSFNLAEGTTLQYNDTDILKISESHNRLLIGSDITVEEGDYITAVGDGAADGSHGSNNTYLGRDTGGDSLASDSVFAGDSAGGSSTGTDALTHIGAYAGYQSAGSNEIAIGCKAAYGNQSDDCIFIGNHSGMNNTSPGIFEVYNSSFSSPMLYGDMSSGNLGIGCDLVSYAVNVSRDEDAIYNATSASGVAGIRMSGNTYAWNFIKDSEGVIRLNNKSASYSATYKSALAIDPSTNHIAAGADNFDAVFNIEAQTTIDALDISCAGTSTGTRSGLHVHNDDNAIFDIYDDGIAEVYKTMKVGSVVASGINANIYLNVDSASSSARISKLSTNHTLHIKDDTGIILGDSDIGVAVGSTSVLAGKFNVISDDSTAPSELDAWDLTYSTFGAASSSTGSAIGLGYNDTDGVGNIICKSPGSSYKDLQYNASEHIFLGNDAPMVYINSTGFGVGETPTTLFQTSNGQSGLDLTSYANVFESESDAELAIIAAEGYSSSLYLIPNADTDLLASFTVGNTGTLSLTTNNSSGSGIIFFDGGNLGIGTSPETFLHVCAADSGASLHSNADVLVEGSESVTLQLATTSANSAGIVFSDEDSTTAGWLMYRHASDNLSLGVSDANALTVTSDGCAIGTLLSPSAQLHVQASDSGADFNSLATIITESSGNNYIEIATPSTATGGILFGDSGSSAAGSITYSHSTNALAINTNGSQRMSLNSTGMGLGTSSPEVNLHVYDSNSSASASSHATIFTESSSDNYIQIASSTSDTCAIIFGDSGDNDAGGIYYDNSTDILHVRSGGSNTLYVNDDKVGINDSTPSYGLDVSGQIRATNGYIGRTNGTNKSGCIGQYAHANSTISMSSSTYGWVTMSLSAGIWLLTGSFFLDTSSSRDSYHKCCFSTTKKGFDNYYTSQLYPCDANDLGFIVPSRIYNITSTTTVYMNFHCDESATGTLYYNYYAIRIA